MHFTGEITLGNLLTIITLVGIAVRFGFLAGYLQTTVSQHTARLDKYETSLLDVVSNVQRMIGRVEGVQDRLDHRGASAR
jgi:hypothetical protein